MEEGAVLGERSCSSCAFYGAMLVSGRFKKKAVVVCSAAGVPRRFGVGGGDVVHVGMREESPSSSSKKQNRCSYCGEAGHNVRRCVKRLAAQQNYWPAQQCSLCGQTGHNARTCKTNAANRAKDGTQNHLLFPDELDLNEHRTAFRCTVCKDERILRCSCSRDEEHESRLVKEPWLDANRIRLRAKLRLLETTGNVLSEKDSELLATTSARTGAKNVPSDLDDRRRNDNNMPACTLCGGTKWIECLACAEDW